MSRLAMSSSSTQKWAIARPRGSSTLCRECTADPRRMMCILAAVVTAAAVIATSLVAAQAAVGASCPWTRPGLGIARRAAMLTRHLSLADKIDLVEGQGIHKPYVFYTAGLPALCVPPLGLEDGPNGVGDGLTGVTALPAGIALAATWDPTLARRYGMVIGAEQKAKGSSVDLGPTVNIDRDPRWGRTFETFSEDPYLASRLATAEIHGIQSQGVMAQVKHFAVYNQETNRNTPKDDAIVSKRALHEIYLRPFEAAAREANVASIMCSYAWVNGTASCDNHSLLTDVLRDDWNFHGFVTSDYQAIHALSAAQAGADMQQPDATFFGHRLEDAIRNGDIPTATLNTMVDRIVSEMFRFGVSGHQHHGSPAATATTPRHVHLATKVAAAGSVLLKNHNGVLPLAKTGQGSIAVIGPAALAAPIYGGGGSAHVVPSHAVSPLAGIERAVDRQRRIVSVTGLPVATQLPAIPASALSHPYRKTQKGEVFRATLTAPETGTYILAFTNPCHCYAPADLFVDGREVLSNPGTPPRATYAVGAHLRAGEKYRLKLTGASSRLAWATPSHLAPYIAKAVQAARHAAIAVVVVGDGTESEAADRPSLRLPSAQNALIEAVAAANPHTVVVVDAGAPVAMPWLDSVAGVIDAWYPGQTNGTALARVLFGATDPGGHLPVSFPRSIAQTPTAFSEQFPGVGGKVRYSNGIEVGYRWYEAHAVKPLFPFGFGLSYTRFAFCDLRVSPADPHGATPIHVTVTVANVGPRAGSDVAQLYLGMPSRTDEPPRQLVGFRRVTLASGESKTLRFVIHPRQTWWWHHGGWTQTPGRYQVYVGDSSALAQLPLRASFRMSNVLGARRVTVTAPHRFEPGTPEQVVVTLTKGGSETLQHVRLHLDVPPGWTSVRESAGSASSPATAVDRASFRVTPPRWAVPGYHVLYGSADFGSRRCMSDTGERLCTTTHRSHGTTVRLMQ